MIARKPTQPFLANSTSRWRITLGLGLVSVTAQICLPMDSAFAVCTPAGPYNNAANIVTCAPGAGEA